MGSINQSLCLGCYQRDGITLEQLSGFAADTGFAAVEFWGREGVPCEQVVELTRQHGLRIASMSAHGTLTDGMNKQENHSRIIDETHDLPGTGPGLEHHVLHTGRGLEPRRCAGGGRRLGRVVDGRTGEAHRFVAWRWRDVEYLANCVSELEGADLFTFFKDLLREHLRKWSPIRTAEGARLEHVARDLVGYAFSAGLHDYVKEWRLLRDPGLGRGNIQKAVAAVCQDKPKQHPSLPPEPPLNITQIPPRPKDVEERTSLTFKEILQVLR